MEIGPYRLIDDNHLVHNNGSWNEFANLLFVDNPVGTGFSYVDTDSYVEELEVMASQFITFLEKYFALFPEYERDDVSQLFILIAVDLRLLTSGVAVHCWRILCRSAYPIHCQGNPRQKLEQSQKRVATVRSTDRKRVDFPHPIQNIRKIRPSQEPRRQGLSRS